MAGGRTVRLNTDTGFLKLIAIITMAIDHTGAALLPQYPVLRVIGRIAFPIFCYSLAVGCVYTRDMRRYLLRMLLLALVSQPFYVLGLNHTTPAMDALQFGADSLRSALSWYLMSWNRPSIMLTLVAGLMLIWCFKDRQYALAAVFAAVILYFQGYLDYGWRGVALMLLFYAFLEHPGAVAIVPLSAPGLVVIGVMQFIGVWNDFVLPLIVMRDHARLPVMVQLISRIFSTRAVVLASFVPLK